MWDRVSSALRKHRRRIASVVIAAFVLSVALDLSRTTPRETSLVYDLGDAHERVRTIALSYTFGSEPVREARRQFPTGAPAQLRDTLDLVPGHYRVRLDVRGEDGQLATREGEFDAPGEGVVVVHLRP